MRKGLRLSPSCSWRRPPHPWCCCLAPHPHGGSCAFSHLRPHPHPTPSRPHPCPPSDYQDTPSGACYGLAHTVAAARLRHEGLLATRTALPGLLLTGQDVLGDGIILAAVSGLLAAAHVAPWAVIGAVGRELLFGPGRRRRAAAAAAAAAKDKDSGDGDGGSGSGNNGGSGGGAVREEGSAATATPAGRAGERANVAR
jgi:hypothetical protein